jgi:hypothetical protein
MNIKQQADSYVEMFTEYTHQDCTHEAYCDKPECIDRFGNGYCYLGTIKATNCAIIHVEGLIDHINKRLIEDWDYWERDKYTEILTELKSRI